MKPTDKNIAWNDLPTLEQGVAPQKANILAFYTDWERPSNRCTQNCSILADRDSVKMTSKFQLTVGDEPIQRSGETSRLELVLLDDRVRSELNGL